MISPGLFDDEPLDGAHDEDSMQAEIATARKMIAMARSTI
jgi:hypothetical protein